jgi:Glycosyl hydrolase family 76
LAADRLADAERAVRAYEAMRDRWRMNPGGYRRDGGLRILRSAAHLWPFSQALVAMILIAGIGDELTPAFAGPDAIAEHLADLERYWQGDVTPPAYSSDVVGSRLGGDRYYDDNAWVGLALVLLERLRPGSSRLDRARATYDFALHGWSERGGVFWVEQGRGIGRRNHDRNLVSTAPSAQLGLQLGELDEIGGRERRAGAPAGPERRADAAVGPEQMYAWVLATLDESRDAGEPGTGLFWDKIRGDGSIDPMQWSYNQGTMVGLNVALARAPGVAPADYLGRAEAIARKALGRLALASQPPAFNAILFRNLLALHAASGDAPLRDEILAALRRYTEELSSKRSVTLLDESATVQLLALLAWEPGAYRKLG